MSVESASVALGARRLGTEWPTWVVAAASYGGWAALTWWHDLVPLWLLFPAGAWLVAWHGSLQHETIHGHPTRSARINAAVGWLPLSLWLPYELYRAAHLRHHRDDHLTCPIEDPESYYLTSDRWESLHPLRRAVVSVDRTLLGRVTLGPALLWLGLWRSEAGALWRGEPGRRAIWARHLAGVALVLGWVVGVCGMAPVVYLLCFAYAGTALTSLRSFAEHRAVAHGVPTAVISAGPLLSLLYLNNNLHVAHHARPGLAWYRLPDFARRTHAAEHAAQGAGHYRGYGEVVWRYLLRGFDQPVHPRWRGRPAAAPLPTEAPLAEARPAEA